MATIDITTNKDSYVTQMSPTQNCGTETSFQVQSCYLLEYEVAANYRAFVGFDLSSIPAGSTINSATLKIYRTGSGNGTYAQGRTYWFERVTGAWTETGVTWNNQPAVTTTNRVSKVSPANNDGEWWNLTVTGMVQDAFAGGVVSFRIKDNSEDFTVDIAWQEFWAKEYGSLMPTLTVDYTPVCTTYDNVYVDSVSGNDANCGNTVGSPVKTFVRAYALLNSGGAIHILNSGADFSAETPTLNKSYSMDLNGASGYFYGSKAS